MVERMSMLEVLQGGLRRVGHSGMSLKGSRDSVLVVFHPPVAEMDSNSFLTIHGTRRGAWRIAMRDADPAPEPPCRNMLAAFVLAPDGEEERFFLVPWVEYQLMLFWRVQQSSARRRGVVRIEDVVAWENRWDLLGAPGLDRDSRVVPQSGLR